MLIENFILDWNRTPIQLLLIPIIQLSFNVLNVISLVSLIYWLIKFKLALYLFI